MPSIAARPDPAAAPVTFVQRYYALLPGNTDAAFALLGPRARSEAGGAVGFKMFYARMRSVIVQNPRFVATTPSKRRSASCRRAELPATSSQQ